MFAFRCCPIVSFPGKSEIARINAKTFHCTPFAKYEIMFMITPVLVSADIRQLVFWPLNTNRCFVNLHSIALHVGRLLLPDFSSRPEFAILHTYGK